MTSVAYALAEAGFVRFRLPDTSRSAFSSWFSSVLEPLSHRDSGRDGITAIRYTDAHSRESGLAFTRDALPLHVDGATNAVPPPFVALVMVSPSPVGGATLIADALQALDGIERSARWLLERPDAVRLGPSRDPFPVLDSIAPGYRLVRYRTDYPLDCRDRATERAVALIGKRLMMATVSVALSAGEGLLIHNHRLLHGRTRFSDDREVWRLLGHAPSTSPIASLNFGFRYPRVTTRALHDRPSS